MKKRKKKRGSELSPSPAAWRLHRPGRAVRGRSRLLRNAAWLAILVQVLAFSVTGLAAKQKKVSRSVSGVVLDKDENGIAGATVELTDLATGKKTAMFSEDGGRYKFADLEPTHDYELHATDKGLSSEVRKVSSFDARNTIVINLRIEPPKSSEQ
jgi:hypothetical protein